MKQIILQLLQLLQNNIWWIAAILAVVAAVIVVVIVAVCKASAKKKHSNMKNASYAPLADGRDEKFEIVNDIFFCQTDEIIM